MPDTPAAGLRAIQDVLTHRRVSSTRPAVLYDQIFKITGFMRAGDLLDEADALRVEDPSRALEENALVRIARYLGRADGNTPEAPEAGLAEQASSLPSAVAAAYAEGVKEAQTMRLVAHNNSSSLRQLDTMAASTALNPTPTSLGDALIQMDAARRGAVGSLDNATAVYLELATSKMAEEIILQEVRAAFLEAPYISSGEALARARRALVSRAANTGDPATQRGCLSASQTPVGLTLSVEVQRGEDARREQGTTTPRPSRIRA